MLLLASRSFSRTASTAARMRLICCMPRLGFGEPQAGLLCPLQTRSGFRGYLLQLVNSGRNAGLVVHQLMTTLTPADRR